MIAAYNITLHQMRRMVARVFRSMALMWSSLGFRFRRLKRGFATVVTICDNKVLDDHGVPVNVPNKAVAIVLWLSFGQINFDQLFKPIQLVIARYCKHILVHLQSSTEEVLSLCKLGQA